MNPAAAIAADVRFTRLTLACGLLTFAVVVLSAWIRLRASGLDCAPWPACYGGSETAPTTPLWAMLTHRVTAGVLGLGILALVWHAWHYQRDNFVRVAAALLLVLTLLLALLGRFTPAPRLPWVALSNLLGGMAMLAILGWLYARFRVPASNHPRAGRLRPWAWIAVVVLGLQIALGGWVSTNLAASACPALVACDADTAPMRWIEAFDPARKLIGEDSSPIDVETAKLIHVVHRLGALVAFLYIGGLAVAAMRAGGVLRDAGSALAVLLLLQVGFGFSGVVLDLPLWLVTAHNATAALLLLGLMRLHRLLSSEKTS